MLQRMCLSKRIWVYIIVLEFMFLGGTIFVLNRQPTVALNYTQEDLVYDSGEAGFYLDNSNGNYIATPDFVLPKGFYTLKIEYEYSGLPQIEVIHPDGQVNANVSDTLSLMNPSPVSVDFRVKYSDRKLRVLARLGGDVTEEDFILLRSIRIVSSPLTVRNTVFHIVVFFLITDILLLPVCRKERIRISEEIKAHIKILLFLLIAISIPLMVDYLFSGAHDLEFHLTRIEGIKEGLLNGSFPVRMQPFWLHGHGYAVSVFYGDILLYIPALLRIFGVTIQAACNLYVLLINLGTILITYYCFYKMSNNKTALVCTIVFCLNIYRLFNIYARMAVGEFTATMFMPLVLYGMWRIYTLPEDSQEHKRSWVPLTIGCTGIFLSHLLSTEMTALFMIITFILLWKKTLRKKTLIVLIKAAVSTVLLSFWFLIPFLDYMVSGNYVISDTSNYIPYRMEARGTFFAQLFMNRYSVMGNTTVTQLGVASDKPLTVGLASMLVLAGWLLFCFGKKRAGSEMKEEYLAVFLCVLCFGLTIYIFPYTWFTDKLTILTMAVKSLQFSWRFFAIAGVLLAWLLCIILRKEWIDKRKKQVFAGVLIFISFWQGISYMSEVLNEAAAFRIYQEYGLTTMAVGGAEYLPVIGGEVAGTDGFINELTYEEDAVNISDWHRSKGDVVVSLINNTNKTAQVEVPLILYKGYHAITDNGEELEISPGESYRISVSVPANYGGTIRVGFREPWYWRVCELISLMTLFCLILYPIIEKTKKNRIKYIHNHV